MDAMKDRTPLGMGHSSPSASSIGGYEVSGDAALVAALERFIPVVMRVTGTPGLNIAIARGGRVVWEAGFGTADFASGAMMTPRTVTRGGSMAKLYVAVAALQLAEHGRIDLLAPIDAYLADLPVRNPYGERPISVYDLLTHRSGLATDTIDATFAQPPVLSDFIAGQLECDRAVEYNVARSRWTAKVGVRPQYSSFGLALVGLIVERQNPDGLAFSEYVSRHIADPLGMESTCIVPACTPEHVSGDILGRLSTGYARFDELVVRTPDLNSADYPSVSLLTTPGDHIRLLQALMNGGSLEGRRILEPGSVRHMLTPQVEMASFTPHDPWCVGLVVELHGDAAQRDHYFGHGGAHPWGWYSDSRAYPRLDLAVVVLTNKWDMLRWHNPAIENAHGFINEFVLELLRGPERRDADTRTWDWKSSYIIGLLMAERIHGFLGVERRIARDEVVAMARGASFMNGNEPWSWDEGAFEAGYAALLEAGTTPDAISRLLHSGTLCVRHAEIRLVCHSVDRRGRVPVPMSFFAGARGAPAAWHQPSTEGTTRANAAIG
jgi:CubicO group peptidase (beta-lactamase class C family)